MERCLGQKQRQSYLVIHELYTRLLNLTFLRRQGHILYHVSPHNGNRHNR